MMISLILIFFLLFTLSLSSFHTLITLLLIEFSLLIVVFYSFSLLFSLFSLLFLLLIGVCVGSYGVSLLVSSSRSKGASYVLSFL